MSESKSDDETTSTSSRYEKLIVRVRDLEQSLNKAKRVNEMIEDKKKAVEAKYDAYV
jgi:hypothetical protein